MADTYSINDIENLFLRYGSEPHEGSWQEPVTLLEHSLQCAQLAEWGGADEALVAAALLLDVGYLVGESDGLPEASASDARRLRALPHLAGLFPPDVLEPIRMNLAAKRYLVATDPAYLEILSPASVLSLQRQGGPMTPVEVTRFEASRYARDAAQLRRWDDLAKVPGQRTPTLDYYLALLEDLQRMAEDRGKLEVGPQTVS